MGLFQSLAGQIEVELTSAELERSLARISTLGLDLTKLEKTGDLTCRFRIARREEKRLAALCAKQGNRLDVRRRVGLYWRWKSALGRPVLLMGMALLLAGTLYIPTRIFFVEVEGNVTVSTREILEAAATSGIRFGASRRQVRSEKMKNTLLAALPQLQWAGVNTAGCVATISVRERTETEAVEQPDFSSIVAIRDGYILSTTVTRGNALCAPGQTVKAGQVLISPYTDCGICLRATGAEGEVFAQTSRSLVAVTPLDWLEKGTETACKRKISLILGKKRINLWKDSGILEGSCGRMYAEYPLTLPGGFALPAALCVEEYSTTEISPAEPACLEESLTKFALGYLEEQMDAGTIRSHRETITAGNGLARLTGEYICTERISKMQQEQIGELHGKND